jgi:hypothetical protein
MYDCLVAEITQTPVPMNNLDLLSDDDVSKYWEKGEDCRERCFAVYDKEWDVIDFESVCEISNACSSFVRVCYNNDFVSSIDEFARELVNMRLDTACDVSIGRHIRDTN